MLANYSSVKLTDKETIKAVEDHKYLTFTKILSEAFFNLSHIVQTAKILPDNNTISYVICLTNIINKVSIDLFSMEYKQVIRNILAVNIYAMAYGLDIEKEHWKRYQIMQKKSYQHQYYGICGIGKYEIGEYGMDE